MVFSVILRYNFMEFVTHEKRKIEKNVLCHALFYTYVRFLFPIAQRNALCVYTKYTHINGKNYCNYNLEFSVFQMEFNKSTYSSQLQANLWCYVWIFGICSQFIFVTLVSLAALFTVCVFGISAGLRGAYRNSSKLRSFAQ